MRPCAFLCVPKAMRSAGHVDERVFVSNRLDFAMQSRRVALDNGCPAPPHRVSRAAGYIRTLENGCSCSPLQGALH